jgi:peptidoglycan/LPS O-acetylase OafA/YrhL
MVMQTLVVNLAAEKSARLVEAMKIMSLRESVYWSAHFAEACATAVLIAALVATFSVSTTLFNHGGWLAIFGLVFAFCLAASALAFSLAAVVDSPQTAGQVSLRGGAPPRRQRTPVAEPEADTRGAERDRAERDGAEL